MAGYFWAKWRVRPAPACRSTCHINSHPPYLAWTGLADSLQWPPSVKEDGLYFEMREKDIFCSAGETRESVRGETCSHCHNGQKGCRSSRGKGFWGNDDNVSRVTWRVIPKGCLAFLFIHMSLCPHCGEWTFILRSLLPNSQYLVGSWLHSPSVNEGGKEDLRARVEVECERGRH